MNIEKDKELFITYICDYISSNFTDSEKDAFLYKLTLREWFIFDWNDIEEELKKAISERTGFNFNIVFDRENFELRGRLIKIGGMEIKMSKFKFGDKVVPSNGSNWLGDEPYKTVVDIVGQGRYKLSGNSELIWYDCELELYNPSHSYVELVKTEDRDCVRLETEIEDKRIEVEFYIDNLQYSEEWCKKKVSFEVRNISMSDVKKKMTKEEIERALGHKIEIVEE